jgi:hypothetical protein
MAATTEEVFPGLTALLFRGRSGGRATRSGSGKLQPTRLPLQKHSLPVSLSCYSQIRVAVGDNFAVLANLDGFAIEHADAEAVTAEFDCSVGRRNPPFECRLGWIVVDRYLHVGPF